MPSTTTPKLTILAPRAVVPSQKDAVPVSVDIGADGRILAVRDGLTAVDGVELMRIPEGKVLLPGLIE
jgi:cytosine/adenosine deaminase-related metal-dependent hydrolase